MPQHLCCHLHQKAPVVQFVAPSLLLTPRAEIQPSKTHNTATECPTHTNLPCTLGCSCCLAVQTGQDCHYCPRAPPPPAQARVASNTPHTPCSAFSSRAGLAVARLSSFAPTHLTHGSHYELKTRLPEEVWNAR